MHMPSSGRRARAAVPLLVPLLLAASAPLAAPLAAQQRDSAAAGDSAAGRLQRLERVTVTAVRGGSDAPISARTIDRAAIERRYVGQDVPLVLQGEAPSLTAYSETGTGWGYSYIRLRGIDQSRINLSIDGIPLNDPEDQVLYFADFPDLANSLQSAQVQRGVGTSSTGTASFGGSINFETLPLATARPERDFQLDAGSFGTYRASAEYRSGLLPSRFAFYGRLSKLSTGGYRYHSGVRGQSGFLSAGWFGDRDIVKLTATAGEMRDTMAYEAVPAAELRTDRRLNPLDSASRDGFGEQLVALSYTRLLGGTASLSNTVYRISARGDYDYVERPDFYNYRLDFAWYGVTSAWSWRRDALALDLGANANTYAREHSAFQRPDFDSPFYRNTGHKRDASAFAKLRYELGAVSLFGDLQGRWAEFRYTPDAAAQLGEPSVSWRFLNPKVGATWRVTAPLALYASYGTTGREPTRSDMFGGADNLDGGQLEALGGLGRVHPERVHDVEAGLSWTRPTLQLRGNVFAMEFRNEIARIGAITNLGVELRENVARSHRRGVELDADWRGLPRLVLGGNLTVMRGRIAEYTDIRGIPTTYHTTYHDVEPLLTPHVIGAHRISLAATRALTLGLDGRYTSASFLTNTGDRRFMLPAAYVADASVRWTRGPLGLGVSVNNVGDSRRFSSGYESGGASYYYPLAPRNVLLSARLGF